jgi:DNA invertase Pin-like site-specific DNA recombinase
MKEQVNSPKVCFSYVRFSSEGQSKENGKTSEDRQSPIAARVAQEKGWNLRTDLNEKDKAVSAYKGHNIEKIRSIIAAVKTGKIPQGSVMILEAIDRLTRTELDEAYDLFRDILKSGIEIFVDRGSRHFTKESLRNPMDLLIAIMELHAANEYSAKISERVKKAHKIRSQQLVDGQRLTPKGNKIILNHLPSWFDKETKELNPLKRDTIRQIFSLYLKGIGPGGIARKFNLEKTPTLTGKGKWGQGYIYRLLSDRKLIGEYTVNGQILSDYITQVITTENFLLVQSKLNDNKGKKTTGKGTDKITNIFSGVAFCRCGSPIRVTGGKGGKYMSCWGKERGTCNEQGTAYVKFENSFARLMMLNPEQLLTDDSGNLPNSHIQILKGQLSETEKQNANITEALTIARNKSLVLKQSQLENEIEEIKKKIELESAKVVTVKGSSQRFTRIVNGLLNLDTDNEIRLMVLNWIRENVNRIEVNKVEKTYTVDLKTGNFVRMNFDGSVSECRSCQSLFTGETVVSKEYLTVYGK